jgi:hypothetical protein
LVNATEHRLLKIGSPLAFRYFSFRTWRGCRRISKGSDRRGAGFFTQVIEKDLTGEYYSRTMEVISRSLNQIEALRREMDNYERRLSQFKE